MPGGDRRASQHDILSYRAKEFLMMRLILMCFALAIACSGVVQAAGDSGPFAPSGENASTGKQGNRWKSERKSYRPSTAKRSRAVTDRNDAAATAETKEDGRATLADDSAQPWAMALLAFGGLAVTSVLAFFVIRVWRAKTVGRRSRDRSPASAFLAASLVQARMRSDETHQTAQQEEKQSRRAA
jgi:hypothetical protein